MAEAIITVVLDQLASITIKRIEEEVELITGVDKEVENLIFQLSAVQALLKDAEERQIREAAVKHWLHNLEDVSYEINDALDEWNTEILKRQFESQENVEHITKRKVRSFIASPIICFRNICNEVSMRRDIAKRIKRINERLTRIASLRQIYQFESNKRGTEQIERHKTSSFVTMSTIVGREDEKTRLIRMLLNDSSPEGRGRYVILIVGMGGLGKTCFAQFVYNDEKVETHFDHRIWVCVSDPFDEIEIAKTIIQAVIEDKKKQEVNYKNNDSRTTANDLDTLLKCISDLITGKKLLLVLDDVWNPTDRNWESLKAAFQYSDIGSVSHHTNRDSCQYDGSNL